MDTLPCLRHEYRKLLSSRTVALSPDTAAELFRSSGLSDTTVGDVERALVLLRLALTGNQPGSGELEEVLVPLFNAVRLVIVFRSLDADGSGHISATELGAAFAQLGAPMDPRQLGTVLARLDTDNSGDLSLEEFFEAFRHCPALDVAAVHKLFATDFTGDASEFAPGAAVTPGMSPFRFVVAGAVSGTVSRTLTAPLERVKIVSQTASSGMVSPVRVFKDIASKEGLVGLFRGNMASVARVIPFGGTVCLVYSRCIKVLPADDDLDVYEPVWRLIAGTAAGAVAATATYPLDLARARISAAGSTHRTVYGALSHAVRTESWASLSRGVGPTIAAIAPFIAVQQSTYDVMKSYAVSEMGVPPTPLLFTGLGAVAGCMAQTAIHPVDLIRRRMQVATPGSVHDYPSASGAVRSIVAQEGARSLYRGLVPACLKVAPSVAVSLLVRDAILGRLG